MPRVVVPLDQDAAEVIRTSATLVIILTGRTAQRAFHTQTGIQPPNAFWGPAELSGQTRCVISLPHPNACQSGRSFRAGITHMGFYADGMIEPEIARIRYREDQVRLTQAEAAIHRTGPGPSQLVATVIAGSLRTASGTP